jgi:hypothetical protein
MDSGHTSIDLSIPGRRADQVLFLADQKGKKVCLAEKFDLKGFHLSRFQAANMPRNWDLI